MKKANGELPNLNPPPAKPIPSWASPELRRWVREIRKKPRRRSPCERRPPSGAIKFAQCRREDDSTAPTSSGKCAMAVIPDTNIVVKGFLDEEDSHSSKSLMYSPVQMIAPDLMLAEFFNAV